MTNLKCITPKNYALTLDKTYEVQVAEGDYVYVINDNGDTARYHQTLFEIVPNEPELNITHSSAVNRGEQYNRTDINFVITYGDIVTSTNVHILPSHISCGAAAIQGLNNVAPALIRFSHEIQQICFARINEILKEKAGDISTLLYSTNISCNGYIDLISRFFIDLDSREEYSVVSADAYNHNSGNNIRTWIVICEQPRDVDDEDYEEEEECDVW